eukprot:COSAG02_NODE_24673_length_680_cov_1.765921_1_plen_54_part_01
MNSSTPPQDSTPPEKHSTTDSLRFANRMYDTVSLSNCPQLTVYFTNYGSGSPFT